MKYSFCFEDRIIEMANPEIEIWERSGSKNNWKWNRV